MVASFFFFYENSEFLKLLMHIDATFAYSIDVGYNLNIKTLRLIVPPCPTTAFLKRFLFRLESPEIREIYLTMIFASPLEGFDWCSSDWKEIDGFLSSARFAKLKRVAISIYNDYDRLVPPAFHQELTSLDAKGVVSIDFKWNW